uniref:Anaerobic ribonucleoside triphosphate reductase n=1 Tax=Siphoviridae sp. ctxMM9 TaxID=2827973 RepID=A0A8S5T5S3_9CAUD|nr:MAG TPA: anaerobic ribonucleoside triphosphate reductase [Siphoviridae sp. ctxMM9]
MVDKEIRDCVQTIQYQLITMSTTNGQAPFTSIFMWIDEAPEGQTRDDLVKMIKEILVQRIAGVPNE